MVWEAISNTWKSVSSDFQTPVGLKKLGCTSFFFQTTSHVWKLGETLFLMFDILHLLYIYCSHWIDSLKDSLKQPTIIRHNLKFAIQGDLFLKMFT